MPLNLKFNKRRVSILRVATARSQVVLKSTVNATRVECLAPISVLAKAVRTVKKI